MTRRGKVSPDVKIKSVTDYLSGKKSRSQICYELQISTSTFREWVRKLSGYGEKDLITHSVNRSYCESLKMQAIKEHLRGELSPFEICNKYNISSSSLLRLWVRKYNNHRDFKQPNHGGEIYMVKRRDTTLDERIEIVSYCIANNRDYGKTIKQYGISYQQVYGWVKKYETSGTDGLLDRRGKRKDEACMSEVEKLRVQLKLKDAENLRLQMENELLKKLEEIERGRDID